MALSSKSFVIGLLVAGGCGGGGGFPDAAIDMAIPPGTFTVSWTVTDSSSQSLSCDPIGAQSVTVLAHNLDFEGGSTEVFTCATGSGTSQGLAPGSYDMDFELGGVDGVLATAPAQRGVTITSGSDTQLDPLSFSVDATGAFALSLSSGKAGGNCADTASGGAGITATTITLEHSGSGTCEPVTFAISAGATNPAGTYTVDCTTPATGPCIETDQTLSATGVPSDSYTIHVEAAIATGTCWSNNDALQVPPLGKVLTRTLNLGYAAGTSGCP